MVNQAPVPASGQSLSQAVATTPPTTAASSSNAQQASASTPEGNRRFSSTGRFLNRFFRRLIPRSPSSVSSSQYSESEDTTTTASAQSEENRPDAKPDVESNASEPASPTNNMSIHANQENRPPASSGLDGSMARLSLDDASPGKAGLASSAGPLQHEAETDSEKATHHGFMDQALDMARLALRTNETPVGCVVVHNNKVIAKGMNATNVTRNGTRHAEFMAVSALLSYRPAGVTSDDAAAEPRHVPTEMSAAEREQRDREKDAELGPDPSLKDTSYVKNGHLYPYGQKQHPDPRVPRSIIRESVLYVTVEPCVMCAGLLRQLGIRKVYFGAVNDKFGGAGGVFSIHLNSIRPQDRPYIKELPSESDNNDSGTTAPSRPVSAQSAQSAQSTQPAPKPQNGQYHMPQSNPDGDGGNVERGFEIEGGWGREEAVGLLRRFYVQENGRAPQPRKKEGRAARLAAMEAGNSQDAQGVVTGGTPEEVGAAETVDEKELATNAENPLQTPTLETVSGPLGSSDKTD